MKSEKLIQADKEYEEWLKKQPIKKSIGLTHLLRKSKQEVSGYIRKKTGKLIYNYERDKWKPAWRKVKDGQHTAYLPNGRAATVTHIGRDAYSLHFHQQGGSPADSDAVLHDHFMRSDAAKNHKNWLNQEFANNPIPSLEDRLNELAMSPALSVPLDRNIPNTSQGKRIAVQTISNQFNEKYTDSNQLINTSMACRIKVSVGGLSHYKNMAGDPNKWSLLGKLDKILRDAIYLRSEYPDTRKESDPNKIAYHKLGINADVGGTRVLAIITIQEDKNGDWIYDAGVKGLQIKQPVVSKTGQTENATHGQLSAQQQAIIRLAHTMLEGNAHLTKSKPASQNDIRKSIIHLPALIKSRKLHGRIDFNGLQISIETGRSRCREWYNPHDGSQGMSRMWLPYGEIRGTVGTDNDPVDVFVGPDHSAKEVYVVHTMKAPDFTLRDEDKCFIGLNSPEEAKRAFHASYNDPRFFGSMSIWPFDEFKEAVYQHKGKFLDNTKYLPPTESENGIKLGTGRFFTIDELSEAAKRYCPEKYADPAALKKSGEAICKQIGDSMGIDWKQYDLDEFADGMFDEQEHADVVDGDQTKIARIVMEHLDEDPHYYSNMAKVKKMGLVKACHS